MANDLRSLKRRFLVCLAALILGWGLVPTPSARALGLYASWSDGTSPYSSFLSAVTLTASGGSYATLPFNVGDGAYDLLVSPVSATTLYVLSYSSDVIYTVNTATGAVSSIPLSYGGSGVSPWEGVVSPDGKTLYFSNYYNSVYALDLSTGTLTPLPLNTSFGYSDIYPYSVALGPHAQHLYVAEIYGGTKEYGAVDQIDLATGQVTNTYNFYNYYYGSDVASGVKYDEVFYPFGVVVSPDGSTLYVGSSGYATSSSGNGVLDVINVQSGELENVIPDTDTTVYTFYGQIAMDPANDWIYATFDGGSSVLAYDPATGQSTTIVTSGLTEPLPMTFGSGGDVLYVGNNDAPAGSSTASLAVIDTNPTDPAFNTVTDTVRATTATGGTGSGSYYLWSLAYTPPLLAASVTTEAPAGPTSGNLSSSVLNATGCAVTYSVLTPPPTGSVSLQSSTGAWTLTPSLADLGASLSFTYEVSTVSSCPATQAASTTGTVTVAWEPNLGAIPATTVTAGAVSGPVDFNVYSPVHVTFSVTSSNPSVVSANGVLFPASCQGFCDLYVRGDDPGVATVTLTATTAAGASSTTTFQVTVTGGSSGSGGTGGLGPLTLLLLGLLGAPGVRRKKKTPISRG